MEMIEIGGRQFGVMSEGTVQFDFHVEATLCKLGLDKFEKAPGESYDDFSKRLLSSIMATGKALDIICLFLVPQGAVWSPDECTRTAAFLGTLTSREDKALIKALVIQAFIGFFRSGLASIEASPSSSVDEKGASDQPQALS